MHLSLIKNNKDMKNQNLSTPKVSLPYIKGTNDKITKILNKHNINVAFTPTNTISQLIISVKDPINLNLQKGVYVIPCSYRKEYIGEIGRSLNIRIKEHTADLRRERSSKSALAEHVHSSSHYICIEDVKLVRKEDHYLKRKIKEAIEIEKRKNNLNRDDGLKLSNTWKPLIETLKANN